MFVVLSLIIAAGNPQAGTYDAAVQRAEREGLPLVVVFTDLETCYYCRVYDPILKEESRGTVLFETTTERHPELAQYLKVTAIPTTAVCNPGKENLEILRGCVSRDTLRAAIARKKK